MERTAQPIIYLDTHIVCWLYAGRVEELSPRASDLIVSGRLYISPIVELELQYLYEIEKIGESPDVMITTLSQEIGLNVSDLPLSEIVKAARGMTWTRDPFDRLIAAEVTLISDAQLITRDRTIREHLKNAVW